jgi:hypothetical protein
MQRLLQQYSWTCIEADCKGAERWQHVIDVAIARKSGGGFCTLAALLFRPFIRSAAIRTRVHPGTV